MDGCSCRQYASTLIFNPPTPLILNSPHCGISYGGFTTRGTKLFLFALLSMLDPSNLVLLVTSFSSYRFHFSWHSLLPLALCTGLEASDCPSLVERLPCSRPRSCPPTCDEACVGWGVALVIQCPSFKYQEEVGHLGSS